MSKNILTKQQIIDWATSKGWTLDKWGHLQRTTNGKQYRFKLSNIALRYEVKSEAGWVRIGGGYYKDLVISNDKLCKIKVTI